MSYLTLDNILKGKESIFCGYGRTAMELGYQYLDLKPGDEILYPGYICDVTVLPANKLGLNIKYYSITEKLEPDFDSIEKLITSKTRAFLAVNYFGFPQPFEKIKDICARHNLYFIEDNTQSFLSSYKSSYLGSFGDIAILSFRKIIPVLNGAVLLINNKDCLNLDLIRKKSLSLQPEENKFKKIKCSIQRFCVHRNLNLSKFKKLDSKLPEAGETENQDFPFRIDKSTLTILKQYNFEAEAEKRVKYYNLIMSKLDSDLTPIFPKLEQGVIPASCPFYTNNRDFWLEHFRKKRIRAHAWPTLPKWVSENKENTLRKWQRIIVFPLEYLN